MATWQAPSAKARFSELLERAVSEGPQIKPSSERTVVLSIEEYHRLVETRRNLRDYLLGGPKVDDFKVERSTDRGREIDP
jgi:antitoxin Phd